jgi:hypothetical protein
VQAGRDEVIVRALGDDKLRAIAFLAARLDMSADNVASVDLCDVYVICKDSRPKGIVLYKNLSSGDVEMICAGEPGWVSRSMLKFVLTHPFDAYGCERVTCLATRKNKPMRSYLHRMGFKLEGVKRKALNGADLFLYGLLKGESKWA